MMKKIYFTAVLIGVAGSILFALGTNYWLLNKGGKF